MKNKGSLLITNIKSLLQVRSENTTPLTGAAFDTLPGINEAFLYIVDGRIHDFGPMSACAYEAATTVDASGKIILPSWIDGHTHAVHAGNRTEEFVQRIRGLSYSEIAAAGGGILNSALKLQNTSETELFDAALDRINGFIKQGTGAIEIKSGYGLTVDAELKMLRVIKRLKAVLPIPVKATFLGAHAIPEQFKGKAADYIDLMIKEALPRIAEEQLADFVDIFCEEGYFGLDDTARLLEAAGRFGLRAKIHVNQFHAFGGVGVATHHNALSVDHLEELRPEDIEALAKSDTTVVALPGCSFFLGIPYTPVQTLIKHDIPFALASDYNPGSSPSGNMNMVLNLACIKMGLTPEQAINAMTLNAAHALQLEDEMGSIAKGKRANFIITRPIDSIADLPYAFGDNLIDSVFINGDRLP